MARESNRLDPAPARACVAGNLITAPPGRELALRARSLHTLVPGQAIVHDAAVLIGPGETIAWAGRYAELPTKSLPHVVDLGDVALCPGLINAHTHLELAHLRGQAPAVDSFSDWVRWLLAQPLAARPEAVDESLKEMAESGCCAFADIATRDADLTAARAGAAGLSALIFSERFGWSKTPPLDPADPAWPEQTGDDAPRRALAGHALYSTDPVTLRQAKAWDNARSLPFSLHLAEHPGEIELLATGTGEFADLLRARVLPAAYRPPGLSPVAHAARLGLLDAATLAVHCVNVSPADITLLAGHGTSVCLCPRSNARLHCGQAPALALFQADITICLGTDSLASNADLDLWNEARALLQLCGGSLPPATLLATMTHNPARALGFHNLGQIAPGKRARLAVVPPDFAE